MYLCQVCQQRVDGGEKLGQKNNWSKRIHFFPNGAVVVYRHEGGRAETYCGDHLPAGLRVAWQRAVKDSGEGVRG